MAAFAAETVIDELCERLAIDPVEFRLRNAAREGARQPTGPIHRRIGFEEVLEAAQSHPHLAGPLPGANRGRGIAAGAWFNGTGPASAVASVNPGRQPSAWWKARRTSAARASRWQMHLAEVLGIPVTDVKPAIVDTDSIGYSSGAGGSGVTFKMGTACYQAAQDIRGQMIDRAARIWDVDPTDVEYDGGTIRHRRDTELQTSFKALAPRLNGTGGPIVGRGTVNPGGVGSAFGLHVVDVEVDPETGKVDILRFTAFQDAGRAIHPSYVGRSSARRGGAGCRLGPETRNIGSTTKAR